MKTGNREIDLEDLAGAKRGAPDVSAVIAYSTEGRYKGQSDEVECLNSEDLLRFAREKPNSLPPLVRRLFQTAIDA